MIFRQSFTNILGFKNQRYFDEKTMREKYENRHEELPILGVLAYCFLYMISTYFVYALLKIKFEMMFLVVKNDVSL